MLVKHFDAAEFQKFTGARVRQIRNALDVTQVQMAERTGILQGNLSRLERGGVAWTSDTILRVARALGVQPAVLVGGPMPMPMPDLLTPEERAIIEARRAGDYLKAMNLLTAPTRQQ